MASIETIRRITISAQTEGVNEAAASLRNLAGAEEGVASASQLSERAMESVSRRVEALKRQTDDAYRARQEIQRVDRTIQMGTAQGLLSPAEGNQLLISRADQLTAKTKATREMDQMVVAARQLKAAIDPLAHAQELYNEKLAQYDRLASKDLLTSDQLAKARSRAADELAKVQRENAGDGAPAGFSGQRAQILQGVMRHSFDAIASGRDPITALTMEAGHLQAALAMGEGGVAGGLKAVLNMISPVTVGVAGLGTAFVVAAYGASRFMAEQKDIAASLTGLGRGTNATPGSLNNLAETISGPLNISRSAARGVVEDFAAVGRIAPEVFKELVLRTKDYAHLTGHDLPTASKELAAAFANLGAGGDELDKKFNIFSATTRELYNRQVAQGNATGAQITLMNAMLPALGGAVDKTTLLGKAWEYTTNQISKGVEVVGRAAAGPFMEAKPAGATPRFLEPYGGKFKGVSNTSIAEIAARDLDEKNLREFLKRDAEATKQRQQDLSKAADEITRSLRAEDEGLKAVSDRLSKLNEAMAKGAVEGIKFADTMDALQKLQSQRTVVADDIAKGGSAAALAQRTADLAKATAGLGDYEKGLAALEQKYNEMVRAHARAGDLGTDTFQGLEKARDTEKQAFFRESQERAKQQSVLPPYYAQMITGIESRGDPDAKNPLSTATGLGQFVSSTWIPLFKKQFSDIAAEMGNAETEASRQAILELRRDPRYAVPMTEALGRQNAARLSREGVETSDRNLYLAHFLGAQGALDALGADPSRSARSVLGNDAANANPNIIGGGRSIQDVLDYAARKTAQYTPETRALREQTTAMKENEGVVGESIQATERLAKVQELFAAQRERNTELSRGFASATDLMTASTDKLSPSLRAARQALLDEADASAKTKQSLEDTKLGRDLLFERAQLGRGPVEQAVSLRLRPTYGDNPSGPQAEFLAGEIRFNEQLKITRDLSSDTFKGFVSDIRKGVSATDALHNGLNRIADKLIDIAENQIIASLFGGEKAAGGGLIGNLFGMLGSGGGLSTVAGDTSSFGAIVQGLSPHALGGNLSSGGWNLVGERGPELIAPDPSNRSVVPNDVIRTLAQPAAAPNMNVNVEVHEAPGVKAQVKQTQGPQGPSIRVQLVNTLTEVIHSGELDGPMRQRYGASTAG